VIFLFSGNNFGIWRIFYSFAEIFETMEMHKDFYIYQAQTTKFAAGFEVEKAEGSYIYGTDGRKYLDFVAGVSANTLGHSHPKIVNAIKEQAINIFT
jgi:4-aminobutyrate aminotransferase-like enzyme